LSKGLAQSGQGLSLAQAPECFIFKHLHLIQENRLSFLDMVFQTCPDIGGVFETAGGWPSAPQVLPVGDDGNRPSRYLPCMVQIFEPKSLQRYIQKAGKASGFKARA
jgi:hypothetical protein